MVSIEISEAEGRPIAILLETLNVKASTRVVRLLNRSRELTTALRGSGAGAIRRNLVRVCGGLEPNRPPAMRDTSSLLGTLFFSTGECSLTGMNECGFGGGLTLYCEVVGGVSTRSMMGPRAKRMFIGTNRGVDCRITGGVRGTNVGMIALLMRSRGIIGIVKGGFISVGSRISFSVSRLSVGRGIRCPALGRVLRTCDSRRRVGRTVGFEVGRLVPGRVLLSSVVTSVGCRFGLFCSVKGVSSVSRLKGEEVESINRLLRGRIEVNLSEVREIVGREVAIRSVRTVAPRTLIGVEPISTTVGRFFNDSRLSRFVSRGGPLSRLARGEELSTLKPKKLSERETKFRIHSIRRSRCKEVYPVRAPRKPGVNLVGSLSACTGVGRFKFVRSPCEGMSGRAKGIAGRVRCLATSRRSLFVETRTGRPLRRSNAFMGGEMMYEAGGNTIRLIPAREISCVSVSPGRIISVTATVVPFLRGSSTGHTLVKTGVRHRTIPLIEERTPIVNAKIRCETTGSSNTIIITGGSNVTREMATSRVVVGERSKMGSECGLLGFGHSGTNAYVGRTPVVGGNSRVRGNSIVTSKPTASLKRVTLNEGVFMTFVA